jgi:hypothetical protein
MGWGDEVVAAGQAQRLWDADPSSRISIVGLDGKPRWHPIWDGNPIIAPPDAVLAGETVRPIVNGPNCRPYIVYPFTKETGWTFDRSFRCRDHIATIALTTEERARGTKAKKKYGAYVVIEPYTKHGNFQWPMDRWAELVAACPDITFVQHVHPDSVKVPGARYEPGSFREVCGLLTEADCYVRSESGLCHAAAALGCPTVTLFGGCMDAEVMGGYPLQTVLVDDGPKTPCGSWLPCAHCADAMLKITVDDVALALLDRLKVATHA